MYAIANVIYGIPLMIENGDEESMSDEFFEALDEDEGGFMTFYSGSGDFIPRAFGVMLDQLDECCHHIFLDEVALAPTADQEAEYQALWARHSPETQAQLLAHGAEPRVFILWSTS